MPHIQKGISRNQKPYSPPPPPHQPLALTSLGFLRGNRLGFLNHLINTHQITFLFLLHGKERCGWGVVGVRGGGLGVGGKFKVGSDSLLCPTVHPCSGKRTGERVC